MKKRAQITIFIIIAIVIIAGVAIFFLLSNPGTENVNLSDESEAVYNIVQDCSKESLEKIIYLIGVGGGYMFPPDNSNELGLPYYYNLGKISVPSKVELEEEISFYFNQQLENCLNNSKEFVKLKKNLGEIRSEVTIEDEMILLNLNYDLALIQKDGSIKSFDEFEKIWIENRMGIIRDIAEEIVNKDLDSDSLCLTCIQKRIQDNELRIDILEDGDEKIFVIGDETFKINESVFIYTFAIKQ